MSLVLTRIQNVLAQSNLDKNEYRASRYGALNAFVTQSNDPSGILTPEMKEKARTSIGKTLITPVIDYDGGITISHDRPLTITDSENTSRHLAINFATYSFGFTIAPAMYMNNEIGIQRDFQTKLMKYVYKLAQVLDEAALAAIAAAKTTVISNPLLYDKTGNIINAKWTERENILGDLEVIMGANDFYAPLDIVGDAGIESVVKKLAQHGLYNDVNKANEYAGKTFHFTNNIAKGAYAKNDNGTDFVNTASWKGQPNSPTKQQANESYAAATALTPVTAGSNLYARGYAISKGSLGMLQRFERDCLLGTVSGDGHEWGIATLPLLNLPVGTYFYDSVGNYSDIAGAATADMVRTRKEHYGFAVDIAFVTAYNSDPTHNASPILGFNISSEDASYAKPVIVVNSADFSA